MWAKWWIHFCLGENISEFQPFSEFFLNSSSVMFPLQRMRLKVIFLQRASAVKDNSVLE